MREVSQVEPMPTVVVTMQRAGRHVLALGHLGLDLLQLPVHAVGGAEQLLAHFGEDQAARVADEELEPQIVLERGNLPGHGRLAHAELFGGMGEAARFGGGVEDAELVPVEHCRESPLFRPHFYSAASASSCSAR